MFDQLIRQAVQNFFVIREPVEGFDQPHGDLGLFTPDSIAWEVHADFIVMLIGGMSALIMQSLHPSVLAGVWDHSNFRSDIQGRLSRTAYFIAATTYGSTQMAEHSINRVKKVHESVFGYDQFSRPYRANNPHLLAWVHMVEVTSFIRAYMAYRNPQLSLDGQNQYFLEMSKIGELLGCQSLPRNLLDTNHQINAYVGELYYGERVRAVIELLESYPVRPLYRPVFKIIMRAALMNLPDWVLALIGRKPFGPIDRAIVSSFIRAISHQTATALGSSTIMRRALRRANGA